MSHTICRDNDGFRRCGLSLILESDDCRNVHLWLSGKNLGRMEFTHESSLGIGTRVVRRCNGRCSDISAVGGIVVAAVNP